MTKDFCENKKKYLELIEQCWNFDDESMAYLDKRLSDEWEPAPEFKQLMGIKGSTYEDQRISVDLDMSNPKIQSLFETNDESYRMFKSYFSSALSYLRINYNLDISYSNFIENRVIFKKNTTKIKKVFEVVYAESLNTYNQDTEYDDYDPKLCSDWIVKKFERIGASKKSAKKLKFVISFNPIDWLMSSTSEEWSSCFNINNSSGGYQYCLGLPFLAGDTSRMLMYITDGSKKECMGITAEHYQTRTWCMLDESGSFHIVKWYPNDTIGVEPVKAITGINNFSSRDGFTKSKYPYDILSTKKGCMIGVYLDMGRLEVIDDKLYTVGNDKTGQQIFTKNLISLNNRSGRHSFHFGEMENIRYFGIERNGYTIPDWKSKGLNVDMLFPVMKCRNCGSTTKGGFMLNGKYLCYECYKGRAFNCEVCGREEAIMPGSEIHTIMCDGKLIKLCDHCWENRKEHICSFCGEYHKVSLYTLEDGRKMCKSCLDKHVEGYDKCSQCGKIEKNLTYIFNSFDNTCESACSHCMREYEPYEVSIFGKYHGLTYRKLPRGIRNNE